MIFTVLDIFQVSFRVTIAGLAILPYTVERVPDTGNSHTVPVSTLVFNADSDTPIHRLAASAQDIEFGGIKKR